MGSKPFVKPLLNFSLSFLPRYVIAESNGGYRAYAEAEQHDEHER
jgi:hypothetical protein